MYVFVLFQVFESHHNKFHQAQAMRITFSLNGRISSMNRHGGDSNSSVNASSNLHMQPTAMTATAMPMAIQ